MAAAFRLQTTIEACAERLVDHPYMYRPGRIAGTREAVAVEVLGGCTAGSNIRRASDRTAPIAP